MKKYGLNLRIPPSQQKKPESSKPILRPSIFGDDDDDDVEKEISRHASKNKAAAKVEELHKKALEEDPSVFDYDGVFDKMKGQMAKPKIQDQAKREAKYIPHILEKAKQRTREQDVIYERRLLKERSKDDHLFADKEKFITGAYKKKLAEEKKWLEEERLRQIREEKEDVTKMKDMSSFYFGLDKNIAFGAGSKEAKTSTDREAENVPVKDVRDAQSNIEAPTRSTQEKEEVDVPAGRRSPTPPLHAVTTSDTTVADASSEVAKVEENLTAEKPAEIFKRTDDAVSAARERYLARKRAREQELYDQL